MGLKRATLMSILFLLILAPNFAALAQKDRPLFLDRRPGEDPSVIDITEDVAQNPDFLVTTERIESWEREHGRIPAGAWVLLRTGWSRRTGAEFINVSEDGPHSPGFDAKASRMLATERDVLGVGVETIGTDAGQAGGFDPPFPNHTIMHGAGKFGLASLCNLDQLPATGAVVIAAPLKIVNGSGSPLRVIAIAPA